jgi:hypothetical protein
MRHTGAIAPAWLSWSVSLTGCISIAAMHLISGAYAVLLTGTTSRQHPTVSVQPFTTGCPRYYHPTEFDLWLDRSMNNLENLKHLYQAYPSDLMQEWEVSTPVNKPALDTPEAIIPAWAPS